MSVKGISTLEKGLHRQKSLKGIPVRSGQDLKSNPSIPGSIVDTRIAIVLDGLVRAYLRNSGLRKLAKRLGREGA